MYYGDVRLHWKELNEGYIGNFSANFATSVGVYFKIRFFKYIVLVH